MFVTDATQWAELLFGNADLGDPRRTRRLVKLSGDIAENAGQSVVKASGNPACIEGAYRFLRNDAVSADDIAAAGYNYTDAIVSERPLVLALQDTTGLSYRHSVCDELGDVNTRAQTAVNPKGRTLYAHSTLMLDVETEQVLGLAYQHYWYREQKVKGSSSERQSRPREEKESYKWQNNIEQIKQRQGNIDNVIDVCDREADIYEYFDFQLSHGHRFVVRACDNRQLTEGNKKLEDALGELVPCAEYKLDIQQKGGRKARTARITLSYGQVSLKKPQRANAEAALTLQVVVCQEVDSEGTAGKLRWILYTSEPIGTPEQARQIARYYELRWRVEEFHKIWKTDGTQVEALRMQSRENLRRAAVIQAFVAVRLFQLRELAQNRESAKQIKCTVYLSELSWKLLHKAINKNEELPEKPPSLHWAYYALARLGGWYDSKRTGRVGTKALWDGWLKLMFLAESYEMLKGLDL